MFAFAAFLTAAIAVGEIEDLSDGTQDFIDDSDRVHDQISSIPDTPDLVTHSRVVAGFLIALALVVMFYAGMVIVVRLVNPILINQYIVFFLVTVRKCHNVPSKGQSPCKCPPPFVMFRLFTHITYIIRIQMAFPL